MPAIFERIKVKAMSKEEGRTHYIDIEIKHYEDMNKKESCSIHSNAFSRIHSLIRGRDLSVAIDFPKCDLMSDKYGSGSFIKVLGPVLRVFGNQEDLLIIREKFMEDCVTVSKVTPCETSGKYKVLRLHKFCENKGDEKSKYYEDVKKDVQYLYNSRKKCEFRLKVIDKDDCRCYGSGNSYGLKTPIPSL